MSEDKKSKDIVKQKLSFNIRFKSFIAGIKKNYRVRVLRLKKYLSSQEFLIPFKSSAGILLDGILFSVGLYYLIGFSILNIPVLGCAWYMLKREIMPALRQLISSLNIVRVGK